MPTFAVGCCAPAIPAPNATNYRAEGAEPADARHGPSFIPLSALSKDTHEAVSSRKRERR